MKRKNTRGLLASLGAVVTAAALALGGAAGANAQQVNTPTPTESDVVITKLAQPEQLGDPADGTALNTPPAQDQGIGEVTFEAYLVEGTERGGGNDIGTNNGQQYAAGLDSVDDVTDNLATEPTLTGITDSGGVLSWDGVPRGLYVIRETGTPEGVIAADDFFLSVPLSHPAGSGWLDTIYVYPKNAQIDATKTVDNATTYAVGEEVTWTINANIPRVPNPAGDTDFTATDAFEIHDTLNNSQLAVATNDAGEPDVTVTTPTGLTAGITGDDYEIELIPAGESTRVEVVFTRTGLETLADVVNEDADASVTVEIVTEVLASEQITNGAEVYVNNAAITTESPLNVPTAEIRYGGYQLNKLSSDDSVEDLSGAQFRVYLSRDAAVAGGDNYVTTASNTAGLWETTEDGTVLIDGLRYSGWANGQPLTEDAGSYQTYWLVETQALPEHQALAEPVSFIVDKDSATQSEETITNVPTSAAAFELPLTGGMGTAFLTVLGIAVLVAVLLMARRRRANA